MTVAPARASASPALAISGPDPIRRAWSPGRIPNRSTRPMTVRAAMTPGRSAPGTSGTRSYEPVAATIVPARISRWASSAIALDQPVVPADRRDAGKDLGPRRFCCRGQLVERVDQVGRNRRRGSRASRRRSRAPPR